MRARNQPCAEVCGGSRCHVWVSAGAGTVVFFHANYGKWNFELPHEWADYVRRWQVVQPLGVTHEQLAADLG